MSGQKRRGRNRLPLVFPSNIFYRKILFYNSDSLSSVRIKEHLFQRKSIPFPAQTWKSYHQNPLYDKEYSVPKNAQQ